MEITIVRVIDSFDNQDTAVYDDWNNIIFLSGLKNKDGSPNTFNSEAYNLFDWANDNGFVLDKYKGNINLSNLGMSTWCQTRHSPVE